MPILLLQLLEGEELSVLHLPPIANPRCLIQQSDGLQQLLEAAGGLLRWQQVHPFIHLLELAASLSGELNGSLLSAILEGSLEAQLFVNWIDLEGVLLLWWLKVVME